MARLSVIAANVLVWLLCFTMSCRAAFAQSMNLPMETDMRIGLQSQYAFRPYETDHLIPVKVLGAVGQPGLHYVPRETDLVTLISLVGGTTDVADATRVSLQRTASGVVTVQTVNLESLLVNSNVKAIALAKNDTIYVPADKPIVDRDTLSVMSLISGIVSVIIAALLIAEKT